MTLEIRKTSAIKDLIDSHTRRLSSVSIKSSSSLEPVSCDDDDIGEIQLADAFVVFAIE